MFRPEPDEPELPAGSGIADSETLRRAIALVKVLRNPSLPGLVFLLSLVAVGCVALVLTVFAVADTAYVPLQMPFLISGGFAGVALIAAGALLGAIQAERHDRVLARLQMQEAVDELSGFVRSVAHARRERTRSDEA